MQQDIDYIPGDWIYDEETYPNIYTLTIISADKAKLRTFEISDRKDDTQGLLQCLRWLRNNKQRMIGFNNIGFDYPVLHEILLRASQAKAEGKVFKITAREIYKIAQKQIESFRGEFGHTIKAADEIVKQVDLFKVHHFDNKARSTSLKMIEFNMRSKNIEDLPYPVGKSLTFDEMQVLCEYNVHDVMETLKFYYKSLEALRFRAKLSDQYGIDFTNFNDTKIGKEYFIMRLEEANPGTCYSFVKGKRKINQTKRKFIRIKDCLFKYYDFKRPEFIAVMKWFEGQVISETKGVFSDIEEHDLGELAKYSELEVKRVKLKTKEEITSFNLDFPLGWIEEEELKALENKLDENGQVIMEEHILASGKIKLKPVKVPKKSYYGCRKVATTLNVVVNGFRFDFGTGGLHGSVSNTIVKEDDLNQIEDADVSSMYPNLGISNKVYPEHLGELFCEIYEDVYNQRKSFAKNTPENAVMKLALNGVYGETNNEFSPFYDPQYTMKITINGQLSLCLLAEKLLTINGLVIVQANTDGITCKFPRDSKEEYDRICQAWQDQVNLQLEFASYSAMYIRDVNSYIAIYTNGKVKRKGAYQYEGLGWHQNQSALVVQMAAESNMLHGKDILEFIREHSSNPENKWDFMLRTKVPRSSRLVMQLEDGTEVKLQNICRYFPSTHGGKLIKYMPALKGKEEDGDRALSIDKEYKVLPCNDADDFDFNKLDFSYYEKEARKLIVGLDNPPDLGYTSSIEDNEGED